MSQQPVSPSSPFQIGLLLRSSITECVVGCRADQAGVPELGNLVRILVERDYHVYGLIANIQILDDMLIRQLAAAAQPDPSALIDNRYNRNQPLEISVLLTGYERGGNVSHLLPPRPPLSLSEIMVCQPFEVCRFTGHGRFGYFRHVLAASHYPIAEILAAHLQQAYRHHQAAGNAEWGRAAARELITLLRDDYATLAKVLGALSDTEITF